MKTILRLIAVSTLLLSTNFLSAQTITAESRAATVTATVTSARTLSAAERAELIEAAINSDPDIAADLVEALIEAYPLESPDFTEYVVQAVIGNLATSVEQKSTILQAVAQKAVTAAIKIPATSVPNVVATVNSVKSKLANVGTFVPAVQDYIAPITALPTFEPDTNQNQNQNQNPTPTNQNPNQNPNNPQIIVSDDTP